MEDNRSGEGRLGGQESWCVRRAACACRGVVYDRAVESRGGMRPRRLEPGMGVGGQRAAQRPRDLRDHVEHRDEVVRYGAL
jgi:hypothetical protein